MQLCDKNENDKGFYVDTADELVFDYDDITYRGDCISARLDFLFSDVAIATFRETISALKE